MEAKYLQGNPYKMMYQDNDLPNGSKLWVNICKCKTLLSKGAFWQLGNERSIRFWNDYWILNYPNLGSRFNPLMDYLRLVLGNRTCNYIVEGNWRDISNLLRDRPELQYLDNELMEILRNVRILRLGDQDSIIWAPTHAGTFSVKTAYNLLLKEENNLGD